MVHLERTMHLSCTNTNTISKRSERDSTWPTSPRTSIGCVQNDIWAYGTSTLMPSRNGPNETPHDPCHLGVPLGASKMISDPMVRLAQTVHQSYINTNTISKWTDWDSTGPTSPRSCIGCVQNDIWAYGTFTQTMHLSYINTNTISKQTERDSTWPTSPRSSIGCVQNNI